MAPTPARPTSARPAPGLRLCPQVVLYPAGSPPPPLPPGALALPQLPSGIFGDGSHPTTRLCAGAVDLLVRQQRPHAVLDVGTGTGVLARIARARGAGVVVATDIDPAALEAAQANAALDAHPVAIRHANRPPDAFGARFDLIVANILEGALRELAPALARALAPRGVLLLGGFTPPQGPALRFACARLGLTRATAAALGEWELLMLRREDG